MECNDVNCPKHGTLATRGITLEGTVVSDKMQKTVIVQRDYYVKVRKYQRYKRSKSRIPAHNPPCVNAKEGDRVRVMECRKLGKTVSFVVVEKLTGLEHKAPEEKKEEKTVNEEVKTKSEEEPKEEKKTKPKKKVKVKNG